MSWVDRLTLLVTGSAQLGALWTFRGLFGAACVVKCVFELARGYHRHYRPITWPYFTLRVRYLRIRRRLPGTRTYLAGTVLRFAAAVTLVTGFWPRVAAAVLCATFLAELQVFFRFHVNYFALLAGCLVVAPDMPTLPAVLARALTGPATVPAFLNGFDGPRTAAVLVVITTTALYWGSAFRKLNRTFLDGTVVWASFGYVLTQRPQRRYFDGWYPRRSAAVLERYRPGHPAWRATMTAVVLLEATLPVLLVLPATRPVAIVLGIAMHLGFTFLLPMTLLPFGIATTASYAVFGMVAAGAI